MCFRKVVFLVFFLSLSLSLFPLIHDIDVGGGDFGFVLCAWAVMVGHTACFYGRITMSGEEGWRAAREIEMCNR